MENFAPVKSDFFDGYVPVTSEAILGILNPTKRSETIKSLESILKAKESGAPVRRAKEALTSSDFLATAVVTQRELDASAPFPENDPLVNMDKICSVKRVSNFNNIELYRTTETEDLAEVGEKEDYPETYFEDAKDTVKLKKYGRIISTSMESLANDAVGIFSDLPAQLTRSAQRTKIKQIVNLFAGNATFFAAGNSNVLAAASPLNQANLESALKLISAQTDDNGNKLNLRGAVLVVPSALGFTAERLVKPMIAAIAAQSMDTGAMSFNLDMLVLPWLDDVSADDWYVFVDPTIYPAITRVEMVGAPGPQLFIKQSDALALANVSGNVIESFNQDKVSWKVRLLHNAVMRRTQAAVYADAK